jgi:hypothetical protein
LCFGIVYNTARFGYYPHAHFFNHYPQNLKREPIPVNNKLMFPLNGCGVMRIPARCGVMHEHARAHKVGCQIRRIIVGAIPIMSPTLTSRVMSPHSRYKEEGY